MTAENNISRLISWLSSITWEKHEGRKLKDGTQRNASISDFWEELRWTKKGTEMEWVRAGWKSGESGLMKNWKRKNIKKASGVITSIQLEEY